MRPYTHLSQAQQEALQAHQEARRNQHDKPAANPSSTYRLVEDANTAVLFGPKENNQDWWFKDQTSLALGFENWTDADWSSLALGTAAGTTGMPLSSAASGLPYSFLNPIQDGGFFASVPTGGFLGQEGGFSREHRQMLNFDDEANY